MWPNVADSSTPGLVIPLVTLGVYWGHGLLHLAVDITRQGEVDIGTKCLPR